MLKSAAALAAKVVAVAVEDEDDPENKFPIKGGSGRRERNALASGIQFEPSWAPWGGLGCLGAVVSYLGCLLGVLSSLPHPL